MSEDSLPINGAYHELMHMYHFAKDPVTWRYISYGAVYDKKNFKIKENTFLVDFFPCFFEAKTPLPAYKIIPSPCVENIYRGIIEENLDQFNNDPDKQRALKSRVSRIIPYIKDSNVLNGYRQGDLLEINLEEYLTIKGNCGTMYNLSDNVFLGETSKSRHLRFGHNIGIYHKGEEGFPYVNEGVDFFDIMLYHEYDGERLNSLKNVGGSP